MIHWKRIRNISLELDEVIMDIQEAIKYEYKNAHLIEYNEKLEKIWWKLHKLAEIEEKKRIKTQKK